MEGRHVRVLQLMAAVKYTIFCSLCKKADDTTGADWIAKSSFHEQHFVHTEQTALAKLIGVLGKERKGRIRRVKALEPPAD
ncbi:hypothetical protein GJ744_010802 [Endocarpon pusillum]|uniref:Uncharacterized protein n=1 Tax=Endocarpon pusillum TaxID=364733 RepID=A0A8H7AGY8_9EURO|nr:hypothetical protein GJ744_010802 [Endocarpon pusillum]